MLRKVIASVGLAMSAFTGAALLAPAAAQAEGRWVYVQWWSATTPTENSAAHLRCAVTAQQSYSGHNFQCRDIPNANTFPRRVELWVEY
ncbi:hypothetical protein [Amycolatopsis pigmentata]|uniref:Secreted protein n=1 Tax=Amycolatopsis pigmentata TaxID=450801 RepID=A0ABW5FKX8_9PSEU